MTERATRPSPVVADRPNSVYRYYDLAGRLIYVGVTARGLQRQFEHNATSDFWPYVATQQVEHCASREEALRVERELIQVYRPPFNRVHNEGWEQIKAAYMGVVSAEERLRAAQAGSSVTDYGCGHCSPCRSSDPVSACYAALLPEAAVDTDSPECSVCGRRDCLYGYGEESGSQAGWSGAADHYTKPLNPTSDRCGHCAACLSTVPEEFETRAPCERIPCRHCGSLDCNYGVGESFGEIVGRFLTVTEEARDSQKIMDAAEEWHL